MSIDKRIGKPSVEDHRLYLKQAMEALPKDWYDKGADLEGDHEVGAGAMTTDERTPEDPTLQNPLTVETPRTDIECRIGIWSMRPQPGTPRGIAWEDGCKQGYEWGQQQAQRELAEARAEVDRVNRFRENLRAKSREREDQLAQQVDVLRKALFGAIHEYIYCVKFEAQGRWNPEEVSSIKAARAALSLPQVESRPMTDWERKASNEAFMADFDGDKPLPQVGRGVWREIESAPKDWSTVILFCQEPWEVVTGYYSCVDGGEDKWIAYYSMYDNENIQPTHWQPLPNPPRDLIGGV